MQPDLKAQSPFHFFQEILDRRRPDELKTIAHVKRFLECILGDPEFRKIVTESPGDILPAFESRGIGLDPEQVAPFWEEGICINIENEKLSHSPAAAMWVKWIKDLFKFRELMRSRGDASAANERFNAWRLRQVARCDSELGDTNHAIVHPVLAFELSKGCSVGCWFCGFDAGRLEGVFPYSKENAALWSDILRACVELFGEAAETGICYHATEPSDNPDYFKFIERFEEIMGVLPQTTSAAPLKNLDWTRALVRLCNDHHGITSRFSLLNVKTLRQLHAVFSAEELLRIQLIHHNEGTLVKKTKAGRALQHNALNPENPITSSISTDLGTIACISGFLVNMVDRSIRMVSPCRSSERWPLGYRVHAQGTFETAKQFKAFIETAIETLMPEHLAGDAVVRFRGDLRYDPHDDGFSLSSDFHSHRFSGGLLCRQVGDIISAGCPTAGDIMGDMIGKGADVFAVVGLLQRLFDNGLLNDDPSRSPGTSVTSTPPA